MRRHEYYYLLFSLAQYTLFPNFIIRIIERKKFFINRLYILYRLCRLFRFLELTFSVSKYRWAWDMFIADTVQDENKIQNTASLFLMKKTPARNILT